MQSKNFTPQEYINYQNELKTNEKQIKEQQIELFKEWIKQNKDNQEIIQLKQRFNIKRFNYKNLSFEFYLNLTIIMINKIINDNKEELTKIYNEQVESNEGKRYENSIVQLLRDKMPLFNIYQPSYEKAPWDFSFNLFDIQVPVNVKASDNKNSLQELSSFWLFYYMFVYHCDINQVMRQYIVQHKNDQWQNYTSQGNPHYDEQLVKLIQAIQIETINIDIKRSYLFLVYNKDEKKSNIINTYYMKEYKYLINQRVVRTQNGWKELIENQDKDYKNAYQHFVNSMLKEFNENKQQYIQLLQQRETNKNKKIEMLYQIIKAIKPITKEELIEELDKQYQKTLNEINKLYK